MTTTEIFLSIPSMKNP